MQNCAAPSDRRRLADPVLVEEVLRRPAARCPHHRRSPPCGTRMSVKRTWAWSVGMLNVHRNSSILNPGSTGRGEERGDPVAVAGLAGRAGEDQVVLGLVDAGVPRLLAVDDPLVAVALGVRLHPRRVGAVLRLGDPEREAPPARAARSSTHSAFCSLGAVVDHQQQADVVADDRVLVLQVVVQPEALRREVLADDRHPEVRAVLAAVLLGERRSGSGPASSASRLALREQLLPLVVRQPAAVPVGAGVLAAVVEEADVVVLLLERLDLRLDEVVELVEVGRQIGRDVEVHRDAYLMASGLIGEPTALVNLIGRRGEEELVDAVVRAVVGELVEVEDLAERHAHVADQHHVHVEQRWRRPRRAAPRWPSCPTRSRRPRARAATRRRRGRCRARRP